MFLNIQQRVENGMAFLDQEQPGWRSKIDIQRLHIASEQCCVLGQLRGAYSTGCVELGIGHAAAVHLGFFAVSSDDSTRDLEYEMLTNIWADQLAA